MSPVRFVTPWIPLALIAALPSTTFAQLPDSPGKDAVVRVCSACHEPTIAASVRLTRDGWAGVIADMTTRGARGTDEDMAAVLDYLAANFLGEADRPLNLNTATAIDLESVLELLRKESAALLAYRDKVKSFTSIDDLKDVPGVPFKKIEDKKDRITFGIVPPKP